MVGDTQTVVGRPRVHFLVELCLALETENVLAEWFFEETSFRGSSGVGIVAMDGLSWRWPLSRCFIGSEELTGRSGSAALSKLVCS